MFALWQINSYNISLNIENGHIKDLNNNAISNVQIIYGLTTKINVTPNTGYYLASVSCTNGYSLSNYHLGREYSYTQTITISNNNNIKNSTCTFKCEKIIYHASEVEYNNTNHKEIKTVKDALDYLYEKLKKKE